MEPRLPAPQRGGAVGVDGQLSTSREGFFPELHAQAPCPGSVPPHPLCVLPSLAEEGLASS